MSLDDLFLFEMLLWYGIEGLGQKNRVYLSVSHALHFVSALPLAPQAQYQEIFSGWDLHAISTLSRRELQVNRFNG